MVSIDEIREKVLKTLLPKGTKVDVIVKEDPDGINDSSLKSHIIFKEETPISINLLIDVLTMQLRDYNLDDIDEKLIFGMIDDINENHFNYSEEEELTFSSVNFNLNKVARFSEDEIESIKKDFEELIKKYGNFDYDTGYDTILDQKEFSYFDSDL